MPILFICQKCTVRLARSTTSRLFKPKRHLLHTQAVPTERPLHDVVAFPIQHGQGPKPDLAQAGRPPVIVEEDSGVASAMSFSSSPPHPSLVSTEQDGETRGQSETRAQPNMEFRTYTPTRRPSVRRLAKLPPATRTRDLKAKILGAFGDYKIVQGDLVALYGLSRLEARHAVGQLERLLWGHQAMEDAALRLDQYLSWKKEIPVILRNPATKSPIQESDSGISHAGSETASHRREVATIAIAWKKLDKDRRERLWPQMILSALESEPHTLPAFIQSTFDPSWCPSYVVEDLLYVLHCRHQSAGVAGSGSSYNKIQQDIDAIATLVLEKSPPRYLALEQTVLRMTFSSLSALELSRRYELLQTIEHPLLPNTLLHLASRFAKNSDTKVYAAEILRILTDMPGFDINTPAAASVCTSLLTLKENETLPDDQAAPDILFELLLKLDSRPNLLVLSALMRNFCVRGHLDTAWKIFDLMLEYGLEPDQHVYSILLNGAKHHLDSGFLEQIFGIITSRNAWSPILVNDFLDLLFRENEMQPELRRRQRKKVNSSWRPMVHLYAKFFDLAPLQKFTLFPLENLLDTWAVRPKHATLPTRLAESLVPLPDTKLMQPDSLTLCLLFGAHMRSLYRPRFAIRYYDYFFALVNKKDPDALKILAERGTLVHDIFIRTFMQFRVTTRFAVQQVQKMVREANEEKAQTGRNLYHPPPSPYTWTILLNGFKNHHDTLGVMSVFSMMSTIGHVQPTLPAWNILVQTVARAGNPNAAAKAIRSLEEAGLHPNERTIKGFGLLNRSLRDKAIARLEEMRKAQESYMAAKVPPQDVIKWMQDTSSGRAPRRPLGIVPNLEELAEQQEKVDVRTLDPRPEKQQQFNSNVPLSALREGFGNPLTKKGLGLKSTEYLVGL
ncbi:hypothetical protein F4825DRAFT_401221 [Nemania diffusa]|nr:hypothetical protein F4825DRAFT_401221 [Nemania diffusa]